LWHAFVKMKIDTHHQTILTIALEVGADIVDQRLTEARIPAMCRPRWVTGAVTASKAYATRGSANAPRRPTTPATVDWKQAFKPDVLNSTELSITMKYTRCLKKKTEYDKLCEATVKCRLVLKYWVVNFGPLRSKSVCRIHFNKEFGHALEDVSSGAYYITRTYNIGL